MPVNIRWELYPSFKQVKLENKFAPIPLELPLVEDSQESLKQVRKQTSKLKSMFPQVYFLYCLGKSMACIMHDYISYLTACKLS